VRGKVTPYGFELALNERFKLTTEQYEKFIKDSERDSKEAIKAHLKTEIELEHEKEKTRVIRDEVHEQEALLEDLLL
jgi:hypothetical protein